VNTLAVMVSVSCTNKILRARSTAPSVSYIAPVLPASQAPATERIEDRGIDF
jgi:hypothetical protein